MSNLILKISNGELFDFFDSETKKEFVVGSKRTCDVTVKSFIVAPVQLRFLQKNNVWYIEDLTPEGYKSEVLVGGKRFRKPVIRFDGDVVIRKTGEKHGDCVKISQVKKISGKRGGSNFDLTQRTLTVVGRDPSCDIVVDNPMVNEKHFRIVYDGEDYYIEDLHSTGGTFVNNRKIRRAKLGDYDRISVPSAAYTFFERRLLFSTSPAGIQIDAVGVTKEVTDRRSHGKAKLVGEVSFRIEAGAFVAIVGGSGTGKSTLLDCLNGIRPATGGGIYYDTNDYYDNINSYKNVMGYVPQRDIMHDDLTVEDGLYYTAMLRIRTPMSRREVKERVKEAIADVRLTGREKLKISSLSGGQRKRVSIAMELLSDPKIIFLDEPTSGLSPDLDLEMMDLLKELAGKGRTIVVITHAMENLDKCDRIAFLGKNGRLCFYGKYDEVFRYFNRKSYSRIFAALGDETLCSYFESKYRATEYYKELYATFCALYPEAKRSMLPPVEGKKTLKETAQETAAAEENQKRGFAERAAERKAARKAKKEQDETAAEHKNAAEDVTLDTPPRKKRKRRKADAAVLAEETAVTEEAAVTDGSALEKDGVADLDREGASPSAELDAGVTRSSAETAEDIPSDVHDDATAQSEELTENAVEMHKTDVETSNSAKNADAGSDLPPEQLPELPRRTRRPRKSAHTEEERGGDAE